MSKPNLHQTEITDENGQLIRLVYNEDDDIMDIFFSENEVGTGIELTDHILLRLNKKNGKAISLMLMHFSVLTEQTEFGPRSFPLDKFDQLPEDLREIVTHAMASKPVNQFLKLSFFQESPTKQIPMTYVEPFRPSSAA